MTLSAWWSKALRDGYETKAPAGHQHCFSVPDTDKTLQVVQLLGHQVLLCVECLPKMSKVGVLLVC